MNPSFFQQNRPPPSPTPPSSSSPPSLLPLPSPPSRPPSPSPSWAPRPSPRFFGDPENRGGRVPLPGLFWWAGGGRGGRGRFLGPGWFQEGPRCSKMAPKIAQDSSRAQDGPSITPPQGPKRATRRLKVLSDLALSLPMGFQSLKMAQVGPMRGPSGPQDDPKSAQESPKSAPRNDFDGPRGGQLLGASPCDRWPPRWHEEGPKRAPRWPKERPKTPQTSPRRTPRPPKQPNEGPKK